MGNKCYCGYVATTEEENQNLDLYGCARSIKIKDGYSTIIELCSVNRNTGGFYAPGTKPEEVIEDPNALKEGILKLEELKKEKLKNKK